MESIYRHHQEEVKETFFGQHISAPRSSCLDVVWKTTQSDSGTDPRPPESTWVTRLSFFTILEQLGAGDKQPAP